jgi:hypothetical protein
MMSLMLVVVLSGDGGGCAVHEASINRKPHRIRSHVNGRITIVSLS